MLSLPRISRLVESGNFAALFDAVSRNGRPLPLPVRLRLSEPAGLPAAAAGLALKRLTELTYRPTSASLALARALIGMQSPDGSIGTLASTAVAVAGLLAFADQASLLPRRGDGTRGGTPETLIDSARATVAHAVHRLHRAQEESPAPGLGVAPALIGDELDSAIVAWQLGFEPRFTSAVRFGDLLDAISDAEPAACEPTTTTQRR